MLDVKTYDELMNKKQLCSTTAKALGKQLPGFTDIGFYLWKCMSYRIMDFNDYVCVQVL